jgi:hypothetical protein
MNDLNITTIKNGFSYNGADFTFTNEQLNTNTCGTNSYWILSNTQVQIEGNNEVKLFDITVNTIDSVKYQTPQSFVVAIGLTL